MMVLPVLLLTLSLIIAPSLAQSPVIKIGILGPFTGPAASVGQEQLNWAKLAVADFNAATGLNVQLVEADTQLDPAVAVTASEALIGDADIYAVVGPAGSQEVAAVAQMFKDARLAHISGSATNPDLTQAGYDTFFRTVPTDAVQGPSDANFIANVLGLTKLFIIDDQSSYSVGLADQAEEAFIAAGGEVVGRESVKQSDSDFSSLVTLIDSLGAEAIFFPGQLASQGALVARQLVEQGSDIVLVGADGFQNVDDFIVGAAGASEGAYVSSFAPDIRGVPTSADIMNRYIAQYDDKFTSFGPPTYAATLVALEAIQRAADAGNLSREAVRDEIAATDQELSVLGIPLAFDENGDVLGASFYMFQVVDGAFVLVPSDAEMMPEATKEA
jgi:branched-chain amino acid transport system substrate-binding protein